MDTNNKDKDYTERKLYRLGELNDYEVADDDPDIRGWDLRGTDGDVIGSIKDLIVDPNIEKVRYLDVVLDSSLASAEDSERHLLIPIGMARVDEEDDFVTVNGVDRGTLTRMPIFRGGPVTLDYEHSLRESILSEKSDKDNSGRAEAQEEDFYNHHLYNDTDFYGSRRRSGSRSTNPDRFSNDTGRPTSF